MVIQLEKNYDTFSEAAADAIAYTTNADAQIIKGVAYAPNTLLLLGPTSQEMIENVNGFKYHYFKVVWRFAVDTVNMHKDVYDDRGYFVLISGIQSINQKLIHSANPNTPWPLNGSGAAKTNSTDTPASLFTLPYQSTSWGIDLS